MSWREISGHAIWSHYRLPSPEMPFHVGGSMIKVFPFFNPNKVPLSPFYSVYFQWKTISSLLMEDVVNFTYFCSEWVEGKKARHFLFCLYYCYWSVKCLDAIVSPGCVRRKNAHVYHLNDKKTNDCCCTHLEWQSFFHKQCFLFCSSQEITAESDFTSRKDFCFKKLSKDAWHLPSLPKECLFCRGKTGFG